MSTDARSFVFGQVKISNGAEATRSPTLPVIFNSPSGQLNVPGCADVLVLVVRELSICAAKTKPRTMRGFAGQRIKQRGIWGDRGLPSTRLLSVSRAAAGEGSMIDDPAPE
jgi:hypothetical protein